RVSAVLVLRIQLERDSSVTHVPAILNEALGPLATLYQVREATQTARNSVALALLAGASSPGPRICEFVFLPTLEGSRPLSCHRAEAERGDIRLQWSAYERHAEQIGAGSVASRVTARHPARRVGSAHRDPMKGQNLDLESDVLRLGGLGA